MAESALAFASLVAPRAPGVHPPCSKRRSTPKLLPPGLLVAAAVTQKRVLRSFIWSGGAHHAGRKFCADGCASGCVRGSIGIISLAAQTRHKMKMPAKTISRAVSTIIRRTAVPLQPTLPAPGLQRALQIVTVSLTSMAEIGWLCACRR
jgi:hypothetical protein